MKLVKSQFSSVRLWHTKGAQYLQSHCQAYPLVLLSEEDSTAAAQSTLEMSIYWEFPWVPWEWESLS